MADRPLCWLLKGFVRGYHTYKNDWTPDSGDGFDSRLEKENRFDRYAVVVIIGWSGAVTAGCFLGQPTERFPA